MTAEPLHVVLDTDPGVDDTMAIFYGLFSPAIDIVAIGCSWGNVSVDLTTRNALRLLEIAGRPEVPVARGAAKPLLGRMPGGGERIHGEDGQGNTNLPPPALKPVAGTAAEQIVRLAHQRPGELTLVAVAPLTNLAGALLLDPGIARLYREVVLMGGAFLTPGNVSSVAEANVWHDPEAAQMVLEAGWPVTLVGLDATHQVRLGQALLDRLRDSGSPVTAHLHRVSQHYLDVYQARWGQRECAMHDALALGVAADRSLAVDRRSAHVAVELRGSLTRGMTVADLRPDAAGGPGQAEVVLQADADRFLADWGATLMSAGKSS